MEGKQNHTFFINWGPPFCKFDTWGLKKDFLENWKQNQILRYSCWSQFLPATLFRKANESNKILYVLPKTQYMS